MIKQWLCYNILSQINEKNKIKMFFQFSPTSKKELSGGTVD